MENFTISLAKLSERVNMEVVYTPRELNQINVEIAEVNRPGLFLAGYYEYFDNLRLQIMGLAEMNFLSVQTPERRYEALDHLFGQMPPAVIVSRSDELTPFPEMVELAQKYKVALLRYLRFDGQPAQRPEYGAGPPHHPSRRAGGGVRRGHPDRRGQRHR